MMEKMSIEKYEIPVFTCPECGKNLFEVGVTEHTNGADVTVVMTFKDAKLNDSDYVIDARREQYIECNKCHARIDIDSDYLLSVFEGRRTQEEVKIECNISERPKFPCLHCKENLFEKGFDECLYGGTATSQIIFDDEVKTAPALISDYTEQWVECNNCGSRIDIDAMVLINFYNGICTREHIEEEWNI